jgi:phage-related protein
VAEGLKIGAAFIEVTADISNAERDTDRLKKKVNGSSATFNVNADTGLASTQMAYVTRRRTVDLDLKLNGVAAVGKALAALSGGAAVGKILGNLKDKLADIPANVPKIAATSVAVASIGAAAFASLGGVLSLAGGLASVAGAGLALPGMMAGFAVGVGVLIAALKDAPTVLADLGPAFTGLQSTISTNFWDKAAGPIRNLTNTLLPQLSSGLGTVASKLGNMFAVAADAMTSELGDAALGEMLANLSQAIDVATGAVRPLLAAFTTLGAVGSDYLAPLAGWFVTLSEKFNTFVQSAAADGRLRGWIDGGITGLQQLGSIVGSVVSIFGGLITAANAAGGGGLAGFADVLSRVATIINGPAFQGALTTVFQGAAAGMAGLSAALGPIGDMFVALAPSISTVMTLAGQLAGQALTALAGALSQPAFATGLVSFFEGIQTGLQAVLPHLPVLGSLFGQLMGVVGQLAAVIGPVLGTAISVLAPAFSQILTAVMPLIPSLGTALMSAINALAPVIGIVASAFTALVPVIQGIVPFIEPLVQFLVGVAVPALILLGTQAMIRGAMMAAGFLLALGPIGILIAAVSGLVALVIMNWDTIVAVTTDCFNNIGNFISSTWNNIVSWVSGAISNVQSFISSGFQAAQAIVSSVMSAIGNFISSAFNNAVNFVSNGVNNIRNFISSGFNAAVGIVSGAFGQVASAVQNGINNAVSFVSGLPGQILGALGNLGSLLYNSGASLLEGLKNGIMGAVGSVKDAIGGALGSIRNLFPFSPAKEGPFSGTGYTTYSGKALAGDFAKGILSKQGDIKDATSGLMGLASSGLSTGLNLNASADLSSSGVARSSGIINNNSQSSNVVIENITIDAKNVKDFNDVVEMINGIQQAARTGRGVQNMRIA